MSMTVSASVSPGQLPPQPTAPHTIAASEPMIAVLIVIPFIFLTLGLRAFRMFCFLFLATRQFPIYSASESPGVVSIDSVYDILFEIAIKESIVVVVKVGIRIVRRDEIRLVRGSLQQ